MKVKIERFESKEIISSIEKKICQLDDISIETKNKCVFTKGVFDIIHYGHIALFAYLGKLKGDNNYKLVVCIASDKIVKLKKGDKRPINPERERAILIASLPQVDFVCIYDEMEYTTAISKLQPCIYVKGMDTVGNDLDIKKIIEKNPEFEVMATNSKVVVFNDDGTMSTSTIIKKIKG